MTEPTPSWPDDFYIGYEDRMPAASRRRVRAAVVFFAVAAAAAVAVSLGAVGRLAPSRFEFGVERSVAGVVQRAPYPRLDVDGRRIWLVGQGKFGADRALAGVADGPVLVSGSRIERGRHEMLEVHTVTAHGAPRTSGSDVPALSRRVTLRGEIVDSKCFLGVMNPGEGVVHRDCAKRCLSGGMPPLLLVRDGLGREELVVLAGSNREPMGPALSALAGVPVAVTGELIRDGDDYLLLADASSYRAQPSGF